MWVLRIKVDSKNQFLGSIAAKHQVSLAAYILSTYKDKNSLNVIGSGFVFGDDKDKKAFVKDLKKQKNIIRIEMSGDFGIMMFKKPLYTEVFWNPKIIQLSPMIINGRERKHLWHFGSFERKPLEKVIHFAEKHLGMEFISFREERVSNISFTQLLPELTKNQKKAMEIAINNGYYDYPKRVKMEKLAEKMNISYSTFQAHLKKAEGKIMPFVYKEL